MTQYRYQSPIPLRQMKRPAEILRVISHPVRLKLLELLSTEEYKVTELAELTKQPQNAISQHLKEMALRRILKRRQEGRSVYYSIEDPLTRSVVRSIRQANQLEQTYMGGEAI